MERLWRRLRGGSHLGSGAEADLHGGAVEVLVQVVGAGGVVAAGKLRGNDVAADLLDEALRMRGSLGG